jgi:hypothetical protein
MSMTQNTSRLLAISGAIGKEDSSFFSQVLRNGIIGMWRSCLRTLQRHLRPAIQRQEESSGVSWEYGAITLLDRTNLAFEFVPAIGHYLM